MGVELNRCPTGRSAPDAATEDPGVGVAMVTPGEVPPVRPVPDAVIAATSPPAAANVTVYGPPAEPVTTMSPASMPGSASRAARTVAAVALYAIAAVVAPAYVRVNVPPAGAPVMVTLCCSAVRPAYGPYRPDVSS